MALSDLERYLVYQSSSQLFQQDLITNALFQGGEVGRNLRNLIFSENENVSLTNPYDEAITGTLRADSRAVKQNSRNVSEASSMMGIAKEGVAGIQTALEELAQIIDDINSGTLSGSSATVKDTYNNLKNQILGYISNTEYNGIYMLDSTKWGTEQIDSNGAVYIQAFINDGFKVNFQAVNQLDFNSLDSTKLATPADLNEQKALVDNLAASIDTIHEIYENRESGLTQQAVQLESQSALLAQAAEKRRQSPTKSMESILLDFVATTTGSILDESS
ncbi:flagellin N-terminal helical domain-containing protein [Desulfolutivibrio sp.]|uniref:flagellin N-terminal helical domain-containing protein n=1 Tax=Desulfolutivibrio sp. TaxID=2773296 RepID=UPI002F9622FB